MSLWGGVEVPDKPRTVGAMEVSKRCPAREKA